MNRAALLLGLVASAASWGATGLAVALYGAGLPFLAAGLLAALPAGLVVGLIAIATAR